VFFKGKPGKIPGKNWTGDKKGVGGRARPKYRPYDYGVLGQKIFLGTIGLILKLRDVKIIIFFENYCEKNVKNRP